MPIHLRPSGAIASDVLLPGDPARAMTLAQQLLTEPKMHNLHRGLWGYSGETEDGRRLSIQSTGIGGPSAAIVLTELAELGAKRAIRVGTCGALDPELELGELLRVEAALAGDGASRALGADGRVAADAGLVDRLAGAGAGRAVLAASTDLFYEPSDAARRDWIEAGAAAVEMEAATLFALGPTVGVAAGCLLVVSDVHRDGRRVRISDERLADAVYAMGSAASAALAP